MLAYKVAPKKNPVDHSIKYYAVGVTGGSVKLPQLAESISAQCTVTVHDVKAVLSALEEHILTSLLSGVSVRLGDLGSFRTTLRSEGTASVEDFSAEKITGVQIKFRRSPNLRHKLSKANPNLSFRNIND